MRFFFNQYCVSFLLLLILCNINIINVRNQSHKNFISKNPEIFSSSSESKSQSQLYSSIIIESAENLVAQTKLNGWSGEGTISDPLLIQNNTFDGNYEKCPLILENILDKYIVIENCTFTRGKDAGLKMIGVCFGNVKISHSKFIDNEGNGCYLKTSEEIIFDHCDFINNSQDGVSSCGSSRHITFLNCVFQKNYGRGFYLGDPGEKVIFDKSIFQENSVGIYAGGNLITIGNTIFKNNLYGGLNLYRNNCLVFNNTFSNNTHGNFHEGDLYISEGSNWITVLNNTFFNGSGIHYPVDFYFDSSSQNIVLENNYIDNRPIIYLKNVSEYTFPKNIGQVILNNCSDLILNNLTLSNANIGLYIGICEKINVTNCNFFNNTSSGIYIGASNYISIENCWFKENHENGISYQASDYITIKKSSFLSNFNFGVIGGYYLGNLTIEDNIFINNSFLINQISEKTFKIKNNTINGKEIVFLIKDNDKVYNDLSHVGLLIIYACSNLKIENFHSNNTSLAVMLSSSSNITFRNSYFINVSYGIFFLRSSYQNLCHDIRIENCTFKNIRFDCIALRYSINIDIINCTFYGSKSNIESAGISFYESFYNIIAGCTFSDLQYGIRFSRESSRNLITNCTFFQSTKIGINLATHLVYKNIIQFNNFLGLGALYNTRLENIFRFNYWSDGDHTDSDNDGIADKPYNIPSGWGSDIIYSTEHYDQSPLTSPTQFNIRDIPIHYFDTTSTEPQPTLTTNSTSAQESSSTSLELRTPFLNSFILTYLTLVVVVVLHKKHKK